MRKNEQVSEICPVMGITNASDDIVEYLIEKTETRKPSFESRATRSLGTGIEELLPNIWERVSKKVLGRVTQMVTACAIQSGATAEQR